MLTLAHVIEALTGRQVEGGRQVITDAAIDSRLVIPGALFVALKGERADGHEYVAAAFERGASVALRQPVAAEALAGLEPPVSLRVESSLSALHSIARHWRNQLSVRVIGITGSVGKSTTKELTADVLETR